MLDSSNVRFHIDNDSAKMQLYASDKKKNLMLFYNHRAMYQVVFEGEATTFYNLNSAVDYYNLCLQE